MHKLLVAILPFMAVALALVLGCAGEGAPTPGSPPATPVPSPVVTGTPSPIANVGSEEGDRIPDFTLRLVDGSAVTSAELLENSQPTFLFFFATW